MNMKLWVEILIKMMTKRKCSVEIMTTVMNTCCPGRCPGSRSPWLQQRMCQPIPNNNLVMVIVGMLVLFIIIIILALVLYQICPQSCFSILNDVWSIESIWMLGQHHHAHDVTFIIINIVRPHCHCPQASRKENDRG